MWAICSSAEHRTRTVFACAQFECEINGRHTVFQKLNHTEIKVKNLFYMLLNVERFIVSNPLKNRERHKAGNCLQEMQSVKKFKKGIKQRAKIRHFSVTEKNLPTIKHLPHIHVNSACSFASPLIQFDSSSLICFDPLHPSRPVLSGHVVSGWVGEQTLVLLAGAAVFGIDKEKRRLGVMADDAAH